MVEKLKIHIILIVSILLIFVSQYMHSYMKMSDFGHFSAGEAFMLGIAALWKWARLKDNAKKIAHHGNQ